VIQMAYFATDKITPLSQITAQSRVHLIGICGTAMGQLACLLQDRGFIVSGSDKEFYDPMGSLLSSRKIELFNGYSPDNIPADASIVVIGNSVTRDNPEVLAAQSRRLAYTCFPEALAELIIRGKHSVVVSGTHGKSTTAALLSFIFARAELHPSFFFAAVADQIKDSLVVDSGKFAITEGDEYDSAFFAKVPKFSFYLPDTLIINAIEFDHADIYSDATAIEREFDLLVRNMKSGGSVFYYGDNTALSELSKRWRAELDLNFISFGESPKNDRVISSRQIDSSRQTIAIKGGGLSDEVDTPLFGEFNARNVAAAYLVSLFLGAEKRKVREAIESFQGIRRRQQVVFDGEVLLIEDFAHHPTAVREVLTGLKRSYPGRRLWCLYEPRSNSSRREIFRAQYITAFSKADRVVIREIESKSFENEELLLKVPTLVKELESHGVQATSFKEVDRIRDFVIEQIKPGDLVVVMSNGSFDGLVGSLRESLAGQ